jgi:hypothetical protein
MVFPYLKGFYNKVVFLYIVLLYLLWCFCIQSLVLNSTTILKIAKGLERHGRGIKFSSSSLILSFNFSFLASRMPMELSNASPMEIWILDT